MENENKHKLSHMQESHFNAATVSNEIVNIIG